MDSADGQWGASRTLDCSYLRCHLLSLVTLLLSHCRSPSLALHRRVAASTNLDPVTVVVLRSFEPNFAEPGRD
jgi:hypothetical protein